MTKDSREEVLRFLYAPHLRSTGTTIIIYIQNTRLIVAVIDASVG